MGTSIGKNNNLELKKVQNPPQKNDRINPILKYHKIDCFFPLCIIKTLYFYSRRIVAILNITQAAENISVPMFNITIRLNNYSIINISLLLYIDRWIFQN